jgi:hypothetical protein
MRLYLYNYDVEQNWPITVEREVLGIPRDRTGMVTKAEHLHTGDIVLVHDSTYKTDFRLHGACVIAGPMIRQYVRGDNSPWEDRLWHDEKELGDIIYPFRFKVDIDTAPQVRNKRFPWADLDRVDVVGKHGGRILGANAWSKKWRGNLLSDRYEVEGMSRLLGLRWT